MRDTDRVGQPLEAVQDKTALLDALKDKECQFIRDELESVIHNEFFNDGIPLDSELVDAAISRIMLLDGKTPNSKTMQKERKQMIYGVLKEILKPR